MRDINIRQGIQIMEYLKADYNGYLDQARAIINKFHSFLSSSEVQVFDINNNSFEFLLWGIRLIIRTEISTNDEMNRFCNGELNSYIIQDENEELLLSWSFDKIGNINNFHSMDDFSQIYYVIFIKNLIQFTKDNNIKFQLI